MSDAADVDPCARVDALVAGIGPTLDSPATRHRDVVLVTGPWLAGVSGVVAALRERFPPQADVAIASSAKPGAADRRRLTDVAIASSAKPGAAGRRRLTDVAIASSAKPGAAGRHRLTFVESNDLQPGDAPMAVAFVVSAVAPLTSSDCALLDEAAGATDVVIGVVSKIDVHRTWRDVLSVDRDTLAAHAPRHRQMPWIGVAAAPELGPARIDDLVTAIHEQLADPDIDRRNSLRTWETQVQKVARRYDRNAEGAGRLPRIEALRKQRTTVLRQRRMSKSERTIALRSQVQRARVELSYFVRNRCAAVRGELHEEVASLTRRKLPKFEAYARGRVDETVTEVAERTTEHLADITQALAMTGTHPLPGEEPPTVDIPAPPLRWRRLETRLMMLLGAGFGLGVTLTLSRLLAGLAPGRTAIVACAAIGLALTFWVVSIRGLLHDRAVLDRWVGEGTASLRSAMQQLVATRVLAVESALSAALGEQDEADNARVADLVGAIDHELREHAVALARAAAVRDRELPTLQAALDAVRAELGELGNQIMGRRRDRGRGVEIDESDSMSTRNTGF